MENENGGKNVVKACNKLYSVYGHDAAKRTCQNWFKKFWSGNLHVEESPRSGRLTKIDTDKIKALVDENPHSTTTNIASQLQISHPTVLRHIYKIGYVSRLDAWVPRALTEAQMAHRTDICDSLIERRQNRPFLESLVNGDEKWIVYINLKRKRSWGSPFDPPNVSPKPDLHQKKVLLWIWWDWKEILYFKLLPAGKTINADVYCEQLEIIWRRN